jgi:DNA polymerase-3 subunit gamma/tau
MNPEENRGKDSEYQVIARKWRPQGFRDIVGQEHITRTLQNSLQSGRIAHAFLFSGLRGVGKTTTARILAKALNCHEGINPEPCDKCPSCQEIRAGNSVDVQEIDGASNRGIDSIRELRESVRYGTSRDRFKIFIIDEVHMLTKEAFNGLLKTLEEPPGHVKFIMATTEFYKIPPTIQSRCQKYEFKPISPEAILNHLKFVTGQEGIEISDVSLKAITSLAQGSMRDAQSALDQVISFCGKTAQDEDVKALLGVVDFKAVADVFDAVIDQDGKRILEVYRDLVLKGVESDILCRDMMEHVRNLMVIKVAGWNDRLLQLAESGKESLESCAARTSEQDLVRFYNLLEQTSTELRRVSHPEIHLEMSLLKMVQLARLPRLESVLEKVLADGLAAPAGLNGQPVETQQARVPRRDNVRPPVVTSRIEREQEASDPASPGPETETETAAPSRQSGKEEHSLGKKEIPEPEMVDAWMNKLEERSIALFQNLSRADDITLSGEGSGILKMVFADEDKYHASQVSRKKEFLKDLFNEVCGKNPKLVVKVREAEKEDKELNPGDDPRVQSFLKRYPGRTTVRKPDDRGK